MLANGQLLVHQHPQALLYKLLSGQLPELLPMIIPTPVQSSEFFSVYLPHTSSVCEDLRRSSVKSLTEVKINICCSS